MQSTQFQILESNLPFSSSFVFMLLTSEKAFITVMSVKPGFLPLFLFFFSTFLSRLICQTLQSFDSRIQDKFLLCSTLFMNLPTPDGPRWCHCQEGIMDGWEKKKSAFVKPTGLACTVTNIWLLLQSHHTQMLIGSAKKKSSGAAVRWERKTIGADSPPAVQRK